MEDNEAQDSWLAGRVKDLQDFGVSIPEDWAVLHPDIKEMSLYQDNKVVSAIHRLSEATTDAMQPRVKKRMREVMEGNEPFEDPPLRARLMLPILRQRTANALRGFAFDADEDVWPPAFRDIEADDEPYVLGSHDLNQ